MLFSFLRFHLLVFNGHILNYVWSSPNCYWSSPWFVVVHITVHSLVSSSILFLQSSNFFWQRCPVVLLESQFQPNCFFDTNLNPFHWFLWKAGELSTDDDATMLRAGRSREQDPSETLADASRIPSPNIHIL